MSPEMVEFLAERQWRRMTRGGVPWAEITEGDKRACRALVAPVAADLAEFNTQKKRTDNE